MPADLLAWAKQNGLTVTGGYRTPKRNKEVGGVPNSYHTQGDKLHPQALDLDHKGIDLQWLQSVVPPGYEVIDERGRKGAPHFHIEPAPMSAQARPKVTQPPATPDEAPSGLSPEAKKLLDGIYGKSKPPKAELIPKIQATRQPQPKPVLPQFSKPSGRGPVESFFYNAQAPFNPFVEPTNDLAGMAGQFTGRAALPVLAGLTGGGALPIAAAGLATGAVREDTRQRRFNEPQDFGKIGLSAGTESLVAAPFMGNRFLPNAAIGATIGGAQSAVDQLNSTGQVQTGQTLQDAAMGGVLSGGLAKLFGHPTVHLPPETPRYGFVNRDKQAFTRMDEANARVAQGSANREAAASVPETLPEVVSPRPEVVPPSEAPQAPEIPPQAVEPPQRIVFTKKAEAKNEALRLGKETGTPHEVNTQGGMHFVEPVGKASGIETVKVPKGTKVMLDGEEFTLQGQAGGKVRIKNTTSERIVDEALVEGLPTQAAPEVRPPAEIPQAPPAEVTAPPQEVLPQTKYAPEIQSQLDALDANHQAFKASRQRELDKNLIYQDEYNKRVYGDAMRVAAEKRRIIQGESLNPVEGGLTGKELTAKQSRMEGNYQGKPVTVAGRNAEVVQGSVFGKVKVKFDDGTTKLVESNDVQPREISAEPPKPTPEEVNARLRRGNLVDPNDPEAIKSMADLQSKKPGLYESLDTNRQAVTNKVLEAIQNGEVLEAKYLPKKGDTAQVGVKAFKPSHLSAAGNTLEVFGTNIEGRPNRLIIEDYKNPGASWGFQEVPRTSKQVVPDAPLAPREAITPRAQTEAAVAQVKKLAEIAPDNRTIQNAAKILDKENLTVKDINRAKKALEDGSVSDTELRKVMDEFKQTEGTSNCG